ncbi:MAG TPA: outer membrane protein assembly factor BamC [Burkholderiales bacterium]|nr:outer membrane protein assembly factor BamC [Burkholderiales bacterium]
MRRIAKHVLPMLVVALALGACDSIPFLKKDEYKSAKQGKPLDVPPDLTTPGENERNAEGQAQNITTFSEFSKEKTPQAGVEEAKVLPVFDKKLRVERDGNQRWLVVPESPDKVWPVVKQFWLDNGYELKTEMPEAGVMETDWAEYRVKVPEGGIRGLINKVLTTVTSTSQRNKFRTRLERGNDPNTTEIFISHYSMAEVYENEYEDHTIWQPSPPDPQLDAEMLSRLMVRFGTKEEQAKELVEAAPATNRASLSKMSDGTGSLSINDGFDHAWRRVGLALDRVGFAVEDRDRSQGVYFVSYADPEASDYHKKGWLDKLAFWKSDEKKNPKSKSYRILVRSEGDQSRVNVLDSDGLPDSSDTANRILTLLYEQLK